MITPKKIFAGKLLDVMEDLDAPVGVKHTIHNIILFNDNSTEEIVTLAYRTSGIDYTLYTGTIQPQKEKNLEFPGTGIILESGDVFRGTAETADKVSCLAFGALSYEVVVGGGGGGSVIEFTNTKSIQCTNINQWINLGSSFNPLSQDPISIICWYKSTDVDWYNSIITSKDQDGLRIGWAISTNPTTGYFSFVWITTYDANTVAKYTEINVADGTWRMLGATYDGSLTDNGITLYINGNAPSQINSGSGTPVADAVGGFTQIFAATSDVSGLGTICDPAIYNRVLTAGEMLAAYNSGVPTDLRELSSSDGLIHYYLVGDGNDAYPICQDIVGQVHGAMTNMAPSNFISDVPA